MSGRPTLVETVPARAALAGNPSDGYRGAVVAVPVPAVAATVTLRPAERFEIVPGPDGGTFAGWDGVLGHRAAPDRIDRRELVLAAVQAYAAIVSPDPLAPCRIDVETTIPRSVGLAGSSAIVVATLRAIIRHAHRPALDPDSLAVVALAAEVEHLGIAAGLQDRVVQSIGSPVRMEFGPDGTRTLYGRPSGAYEIITADLPPRLFVAHRPGTATPSGATHRPLLARYDAGDADVRRAMGDLAAQARLATVALRAGDAAALGAAMDRSYEARRSVVPLDARHVEMVDTAHAAGAWANYAGSGGSIVVLAPDDAAAARARATLGQLGCGLLDVTDARHEP